MKLETTMRKVLIIGLITIGALGSAKPTDPLPNGGTTNGGVIIGGTTNGGVITAGTTNSGVIGGVTSGGTTNGGVTNSTAKRLK